MDYKLNYFKICKAVNFINKGSIFLATNSDNLINFKN